MFIEKKIRKRGPIHESKPSQYYIYHKLLGSDFKSAYTFKLQV